MKHLQVPAKTINNITSHSVQTCLGHKCSKATRPRPNVAKFQDFKQQEMVQSQGKQAKETNYGLNNSVLVCKRKRLLSICKQMMAEGKRAAISVNVQGGVRKHPSFSNFSIFLFYSFPTPVNSFNHHHISPLTSWWRLWILQTFMEHFSWDNTKVKISSRHEHSSNFASPQT